MINLPQTLEKEGDMTDTFTPQSALEFAIKTEELGAHYYRQMAEQFRKEDEIFEIFSTLAEDEKSHKTQFMKLMEHLPKGTEAFEDREEVRYLRALSRKSFFTGAGGLTDNFDSIRTPEDALNKAYWLEMGTLTYYQAIRDAIGSSKVLDSIIKSERGHLLKLMEYLITGAKMRGMDN